VEWKKTSYTRWVAYATKMIESYANMSKLSMWVAGGRVACGACRVAWNIAKEVHEPPPWRASARQIGGGERLTKERREGAWAWGVVRVFSPVQ